MPRFQPPMIIGGTRNDPQWSDLASYYLPTQEGLLPPVGYTPGSAPPRPDGIGESYRQMYAARPIEQSPPRYERPAPWTSQEGPSAYDEIMSRLRSPMQSSSPAPATEQAGIPSGEGATVAPPAGWSRPDGASIGMDSGGLPQNLGAVSGDWASAGGVGGEGWGPSYRGSDSAPDAGPSGAYGDMPLPSGRSQTGDRTLDDNAFTRYLRQHGGQLAGGALGGPVGNLIGRILDSIFRGRRERRRAEEESTVDVNAGIDGTGTDLGAGNSLGGDWGSLDGYGARVGNRGYTGVTEVGRPVRTA